MTRYGVIDTNIKHFPKKSFVVTPREMLDLLEENDVKMSMKKPEDVML